MSDNYQAIYDAVRSRISGGNIGDIAERALREAFDVSHARAILQEQIYAVAQEMMRPSAIYRPELVQDGNAWLAMYGDLPSGCVGTGDTPEAAMRDFDATWFKPAKVA